MNASVAEAVAPVLIGRCTACGQPFRAELDPALRVLQGTHWRIANTYALAAGYPVWHDCRAGIRCPEGEGGVPECSDWACDGHNMTEIHYRVLRSAWKPGVACRPGNCHRARNATCACSCRGRNHGSAWRISPTI